MSKRHTADFSERMEPLETEEQRALHAQHEKEVRRELLRVDLKTVPLDVATTHPLTKSTIPPPTTATNPCPTDPHRPSRTLTQDVEELMAELAAKEMRRKAAESMFVEIYAHLDDHHENLKDHTDGLHKGHGEEEGGHH